jgi:hypothetical protein
VTSASSLPVKVWIYGGGENSGGISNPLYDGCNLAKDNTILVSINYRLGALGFLALESAGIGGNFGIQDILLGLQWIQSNIAAFGGDPVSTIWQNLDRWMICSIDMSPTEKGTIIRSVGWRNEYLHHQYIATSTFAHKCSCLAIRRRTRYCHKRCCPTSWSKLCQKPQLQY